jgi:hypothetical protein
MPAPKKYPDELREGSTSSREPPTTITVPATTNAAR